MQLLNDRKLANRLAEDQVSEKEKFSYFLVFMTLLSVATSTWFLNFLSGPLNHWDVAYDGISIACTVVGTIVLFMTNTKGDNRDFVARYMCLSLPIAVQTLLLSVVAILGTIVLEYFTDLILLEEESGPYDTALFVVMLSYFYFRLNGAIELASGKAIK